MGRIATMMHDDIVADRGRRMVAARAERAERAARAARAARAEVAATRRASSESAGLHSAPRRIRVMGTGARPTPTPTPRNDSGKGHILACNPELI